MEYPKLGFQTPWQVACSSSTLPTRFPQWPSKPRWQRRGREHWRPHFAPKRSITSRRGFIEVATLSNEHQSAKRPIGSRRHWISFKLSMESGLWEVAYWDLKGKCSGLRPLDANFLSHPFSESRYTLNLEPGLVNLQIYTFPLMPHAFNSQLHWLSLATVSPTKTGLTWCAWTPPLRQGTWQFQWPRCGRCVHWSQRPW